MTSLHNSTTARAILALAVAFVSSGCAMKGDIRTLQEELRAMSARQDSLMTAIRMETRQTQDTLRTQTDQMFDLRGDVARRLQQIEQSLARMEALSGENQRMMASIRDQLVNLRRGSVATTGGQPTGANRDESLVGESGGNADQLYSVARQQLDRGSLNSAAAAFEQFVSEHPEDPRVADAHFFLADILAQQGESQASLEAFQQIQELFPTHPRVPQAMYRIALLHEELGDEDEARAVLERLMNTYPDDPVSMLAREKLREIG